MNEPFRVATKSRFPCTPGFQLAREIVEGNRLGKEASLRDGETGWAGALLFFQCTARARFHESVATFPERVGVWREKGERDGRAIKPLVGRSPVRESRDASMPLSASLRPSFFLFSPSLPSSPLVSGFPLRREERSFTGIGKINGAPSTHRYGISTGYVPIGRRFIARTRGEREGERENLIEGLLTRAIKVRIKELFDNPER